MTKKKAENIFINGESVNLSDRLAEFMALKDRIPLDELEKDFEKKTQYLTYNEFYELQEVRLVYFLEILFGNRLDFIDGEVMPFEEIQSEEYQHWLTQRKEGKKNKTDVGVPPGQTSPTHVDYSAYRMWRYNPVVFYKDGTQARFRLLLLDDYETIDFLENRRFAIMSPVTYVGRTSSYKNARYLYAFAIDLDGVGVKEVGYLLGGMSAGAYPEANVIVNSGHGLHLYYILETPVAMYDTRLQLLNKFKAALTRIVWLVSRIENPQIQSVVQGFRIPGTLTKFGQPIRAFWNRNVPLHTLDSLNSCLGQYSLTRDELAQLKDKYPHNPSRVTRAEAQKLWPEWYASRVIGRNRVGKKWNVHRGLYDWWLKKMRDGSEVTVHHRYWCVLTLVVYAVKCDIPREEVLSDALSLVQLFDSKTKTIDNPFTEDDVMDAMRAYDKEYSKWPVRVIESTTGIRIERCRRNGRTQSAHLRRMRAVLNADYPEGEWREGNGRKKGSVVKASQSRCAAIVRKWRGEYPQSSNKALCARETGLSRPTVHRWWNDVAPNK